MKKKEFNPDFTSLLDVIMILLFFFITFSHLDINKAKQEAENETAAASQAISDAKKAEEEANAKVQEAEERKNAYEEADNNAAEVGEALVDFDYNNNLYFCLTGEADKQKLVIKQGDEIIETINGSILTEKEKASKLQLANAMLVCINEAGYTEENIILCNFIYNSGEDGSHTAYNNIDFAFEEIKKNYLHLYISDTDLNVNDK